MCRKIHLCARSMCNEKEIEKIMEQLCAKSDYIHKHMDMDNLRKFRPNEICLQTLKCLGKSYNDEVPPSDIPL